MLKTNLARQQFFPRQNLFDFLVNLVILHLGDILVLVTVPSPGPFQIIGHAVIKKWLWLLLQYWKMNVTVIYL